MTHAHSYKLLTLGLTISAKITSSPAFRSVGAGAGTITITADGNTEVDVTDAGMRLGGANSRVNAILDEDDMTSDSATSIATQQSIKAYVRDNAGDPALPKLDFYQDWLQETKYQQR